MLHMFSVKLWEKKNSILENLFYPVYVVYVAPLRLERPWTSAQRLMIQLLMVAQHLLWLYRLTWERQSRLQRMHVKTLSRDVFVLFSFHRARFSLVASLRFLSPLSSPRCKSRLKHKRALTKSFHLSMSISLASLLQMSLKRR